MSPTVFLLAAAIVAVIAGVALIMARRSARDDAGLAEAEETVRAAMLTQQGEPELPLAA